MESKRMGLAAVVAMLVLGLGLPAVAHGENDARALIREAEMGPYVVTLWQVIGDQDSPLPPHLILAFRDEAPDPSGSVTVSVGNDYLVGTPSTSSPGAWETPESVAAGQVISVEITTSEGTWQSSAVTVPELLGSRVPMELLLAVAIFFTTGAVYWLARRTGRVFRSVMSLGMEKG